MVSAGTGWPSGRPSSSAAEDLESNPAHGAFSQSSLTCDFKIGTIVVALPGVIGSVQGLVGPVVSHLLRSRRSRIEPCFPHWAFSLSSLTCDLRIATLVVALPGTWRYRISARTCWPGASIL